MRDWRWSVAQSIQKLSMAERLLYCLSASISGARNEKEEDDEENEGTLKSDAVRRPKVDKVSCCAVL